VGERKGNGSVDCARKAKKKQRQYIILFFSLMNTHSVWIMKRQRKEKGCFFILLFLDEKKQKSSDYIIC
jgi:hypothetical protein